MLMDRSREARRASMTVTNGLVRRRQRTTAFRESREDEQMELQDTVRLRERSGKRNRDRRDMLNRNKKNGCFNRDDGEENTEDSVENDEEDYEVDDAGLTNRMLSPKTSGSSSSPLNYSRHRRNYLPMRVTKQATSLTVPDEMIGVAVPRKARSASAKRSYDNGSSGSGGGGGVGEDKIYCQRSNPLATLRVEVASPSSSNFSVRKKMKPAGPKTRPPKVSKTTGSAQDDIEIEIAEVLYGLTNQPQSSKHQDSNKNKSKLVAKDTNGTGNDSKTWVSPRVAVAAHSQTSFCPKNSNHASDLVLVTKEKKTLMAFPVAKEKRMKAADSSTTIENSSSPEPITMESDQPAKMEVSSPKMESKSKSNANLCDAGVPEVASGSMEMQEKIVTQEDLKPLMEEPSDLDGVAKSISLKAQSSSSSELDFDIQNSFATKGTSTVSGIDIRREERFKIDLMAAPPVPPSSSPERDGMASLISKPLINNVDMKPETMTKDEEIVEIHVKKEAAIYGQKKVETTTEMQEMQKLELEKPSQDIESKLNQQGNKTQHRASVSKAEKTAYSSSVPLPIAVAGWSSGLPPLGYMPPFQTVVPMGSSTALQPPKPLLSKPLRKRCATHHHIACNIHLHQQLTKMNQFWPAGAGSPSLCGTKPKNLNVMPPAENMVIGSSLLGNFPCMNLSHSQEKGLDVGNFPGHSGKDKSSGPANLMETSQRKQIVLPQTPQPASAINGMHAPAFIFPLGQQQPSITATPNYSRPSKSAKSANNASVSSNSAVGAIGVSSALPSVATAVNFNYQSLASKEVPYLSLLQNNGYPFPISTPIGTTPAIIGGSHAQAMPFFNGSFYSSQMLHPSQLQQQQPHPQIPVLPTDQNTSTSSGSSLSHKKPESQQQLQGTQVCGNNFFTSANMQFQRPHKHYVPVSHRSRKLETEMSADNSPSTADIHASQAQKSASCQKFAVQFQPLNYTLMPSATMAGQGGGNCGEKSQQQGLKGGVELVPPQAFAMSLTSFTGNGTASSLNFSSMPQNPAIFQSLPDMVWQGFQAPAPQATHHKNIQVPEGKTGGASSNSDDGIKAATEKYYSTIGQTLALDNSLKTINFISSPVTGNWPSRSISSTVTSTNAPVAGNIPSSSQQQHLFQLQPQNQHMLLQQQKHAMVARSKIPTTSSLPYSSVAGKFANNGPVSSQALIQCNASVQSCQSKNSGRTIASQVPNSSLISSNTSTLKNVSQQGRTSPGHTQISFGGNSRPTPEGQHTPNNNKSSSSFVSGSPPKDGSSLSTNPTGGKVCSSTSTPQPQQTENSTTGNGQKSSPVCGRNVPPILSACPELKY